MGGTPGTSDGGDESETEFHEVPDESTPRPSTSDKQPSHSDSTQDKTRSSSPPATDTGQIDGSSDGINVAAQGPSSPREQDSGEITAAQKLDSSTNQQSGSEDASHDEEPEQLGTTPETPGTFPSSMPTSPLPNLPDPPSANTDDVATPPSPPRRKSRNPFSFFSRNISGAEKGIKSPPVPTTAQRRGTSASAANINAEALGKLEEGGGLDGTAKNPNRNSLRDRFKLLRMQEEAGINITDLQEDTSRPASSSSNTQGFELQAVLGGKSIEDSNAAQRQRSTSTSIPAKQPTLNEHLAPGTAAGTSTGPQADTSEPVDWDLWQAVVYEGPTAVARSSAAELKQAIARGIPSAIRGVVWQVLAESQSGELETVYRDLRSKGEQAVRRLSDLRPKPIDLKQNGLETRPNGNSKVNSPMLDQKQEDTPVDKEFFHSSTSSRPQSGASTPASPSSPNPIGSPVTSQDANSIEGNAKASALLQAEEKKRVKEEAASLTKLEKAIRRDLGARTSYSKFLMSAGLQNGLYGICKAYALYDEDVGYAQGMNFIAMPLLFNMPEEEAFCLFVALMSKYKLRELFIQDMPGLHSCLYQFSRLLEDFEPAVYCHLSRRGVHPQLYATQWFLTLFAYRFPLQLVLRIYDLILSEGLELAILKFGIVLMRKNAAKLLEMRDMAVLTTYLKDRLFDVYIDKSPSASSVLESGFFGQAGGIDKEVYRADALVQDACAVKITYSMLEAYAVEYREKAREEQRKTAEDEAIRAANTSLTLQVRHLEERGEKYDKEHVDLASELVRTKVSNQALTDENESLTTQVKELQGIIQAQPGEVEGRLQEEMERIMRRNLEVQNENRHLEEGCQEMERELVGAKVRVAEAEEELEGLRKKWSSISSLMNSKS
ncbi:MAG: GTPase-activating protein [Chrysothrix sp. TS-e1954]|nr:MAG: GTPase-activating protein [Chrysothrix sp. TS-e1954]